MSIAKAPAAPSGRICEKKFTTFFYCLRCLDNVCVYMYISCVNNIITIECKELKHTCL